jgi:hypothetical protein
MRPVLQHARPVTLPRPLTSLTTPVGLPLTPSPPPPTQRTQHPPLLRRQPNATGRIDSFPRAFGQ